MHGVSVCSTVFQIGFTKSLLAREVALLKQILNYLLVVVVVFLFFFPTLSISLTKSKISLWPQ